MRIYLFRDFYSALRRLSFVAGFPGLNCAEAVNFAPADWLPHGGVGAELYRLYHKAPVISHEELLYVVAKVCSFPFFH